MEGNQNEKVIVFLFFSHNLYEREKNFKIQQQTKPTETKFNDKQPTQFASCLAFNYSMNHK